MLADAVCCCASWRWYFLFLDRLYFEGTVNNPAFIHASLNSTQALQSEPPGKTGSRFGKTKEETDTGISFFFLVMKT